MMPNVASVFMNWMSQVQMKVITVEPVDFEAFEETDNILTFMAVIVPMKPTTVQRKPENLRIWKWWEMWSTVKFRDNTVVQDPNGVEFRIESVEDWSQAGFYHSEMVEQVRGL